MEFVCPRCSNQVDDEFYGPCPACRTKLRAMFQSEARIVEVAEYSDPPAGRYIADTLIERREKIGRYFFSQVLPLDLGILLVLKPALEPQSDIDTDDDHQYLEKQVRLAAVSGKIKHEL